MNFDSLREELKAHYWFKTIDLSENFYLKTTKKLDALYREEMTVYEMKLLQYKVISEDFEPILFLNSPFYYETGTMFAHCDGAGTFHGHKHAGDWTYHKNQHLFKEQDEKLWSYRTAQKENYFYLICGPYNDTKQHFAFNYRPVLSKGLKGIYEEAKERLKTCKTQEEKRFINGVMQGMYALKCMAEKFSRKAEEMLLTAKIGVQENLRLIADTARRIPWEKPQTFYEALNTYAFLRKAIGSLEGIGVNSFGRMDLDLYPFYERDVNSGRLTKEEAYRLICQFLITWDMHYDHDMKMEYYADHELENTYVLGGCDENGNPVYNDLTKLFLQAARIEKIIYPKIKCRFGINSPKEYLDEINKSVISGNSSLLFQNDESTIAALLKAGRTLEEARDYVLHGCWGLQCHGLEKFDGGNYVNMLKCFEYSLHNLTEKMDAVGMQFDVIDGAESFEEVYKITLNNIKTLFEERIRITKNGGNIWNKVDVLPIFSSTLSDCIEKAKDYTEKGARYNDEQFMCFGFPNIIDSLLAIKQLCFDTKKYTLKEMLEVVRNNWEGRELMRIEAMRCNGWGDGSEESCVLAERFNRDLYTLVDGLEGSYGGKVHLSYLTYTEVVWWGKQLLATPDGRKNGDYLSQGLTPSRLKKISAVSDVLKSFSVLDKTLIQGGSVVNIILPSNKITLDTCYGFLKAVAKTAVQTLQLNCVTKEQLLDAQKHPEKYPDLIVRVTGFSAKFTALSKTWQEEVLTRNFYD